MRGLNRFYLKKVSILFTSVDSTCCCLFLLVLFLSPLIGFSQSSVFIEQSSIPRRTDTLRLLKEKKLGIDFDTCVDLENKIGQLFFIFTDGHGSNPPAVVHPLYIKAIQEYKFGGVRLDSNGGSSGSYKMYSDATEKLQSTSKIPLLIGVDSVSINYFKLPSFSPSAISKMKEELKRDPKYKEYIKDLDSEEVNNFLEINAIAKLREQVGLISREQQDKRKKFFGLGTYSGFLAHVKKLPNSCVEQMVYLQAFLHKALRINMALGPTIDPSNRDPEWLDWWNLSTLPPDTISSRATNILDIFHNFGIATSLKHFPYTPVSFDIHYQNKAVNDDPIKVRQVVDVFQSTNMKAKKPADFIMTTHLLNQKFDSMPATISPKWIDILRKEHNYQGIIITDGIKMIDAEGPLKAIILDKWKQLHGDMSHSSDTIFTVLSILAGNDMVIIDASLSISIKLFQNLLQLSCENSTLGKSLRERIQESYTRIVDYKLKNREQLTANKTIPENLFHEALALYFSDDIALFSPQNTRSPCANKTEFQRWKNSVESLMGIKINPIQQNSIDPQSSAE